MPLDNYLGNTFELYFIDFTLAEPTVVLECDGQLVGGLFALTEAGEGEEEEENAGEGEGLKEELRKARDLVS